MDPNYAARIYLGYAVAGLDAEAASFSRDYEAAAFPGDFDRFLAAIDGYFARHPEAAR